MMQEGTFAGTLVRTPSIWLRIVAWVCAIIVFGTIADNGYPTIDGHKYCVFNLKDDACNFGLATGIMAFIAATVLLALHIVVQKLKERNELLLRAFEMFDLVASAILALLYFVCFIFLANDWRVTNSEDFSTSRKNNARSAIAFSFFSVLLWGALTVFAGLIVYRRFKGGSSSSYAPIVGDSSSGYGATPSSAGNSGAEKSPYDQPQA